MCVHLAFLIFDIMSDNKTRARLHESRCAHERLMISLEAILGGVQFHHCCVNYVVCIKIAT